ncbi:hypothetical protein CCP3SC5AM1_2320006 [Gammaproteobacteria bacterium]
MESRETWEAIQAIAGANIQGIEPFQVSNPGTCSPY